MRCITGCRASPAANAPPPLTRFAARGTIPHSPRAAARSLAPQRRRLLALHVLSRATRSRLASAAAPKSVGIPDGKHFDKERRHEEPQMLPDRVVQDRSHQCAKIDHRKDDRDKICRDSFEDVVKGVPLHGTKFSCLVLVAAKRPPQAPRPALSPLVCERGKGTSIMRLSRC